MCSLFFWCLEHILDDNVKIFLRETLQRKDCGSFLILFCFSLWKENSSTWNLEGPAAGAPFPQYCYANRQTNDIPLGHFRRIQRGPMSARTTTV